MVAHTSCENDPDLIPWLKRIAKQTANVNVSTETCDLIVQNAPNHVLVSGEDVSMENDMSESQEGGEDEMEEMKEPVEEPEEEPEEEPKEEPKEEKPVTRAELTELVKDMKSVIDTSILMEPNLKHWELKHPIGVNLASARTAARRTANATVGAKPHAQASQASVDVSANGEGEKGDDNDDDDDSDIDIKEEDLEGVLDD